MLRIQFQTTEQGRAVVFQPDGIRLFIQAELSLASMLMLWLMRYCRGVSVRAITDQTGERHYPF